MREAASGGSVCTPAAMGGVDPPTCAQGGQESRRCCSDAWRAPVDRPQDRRPSARQGRLDRLTVRVAHFDDLGRLTAFADNLAPRVLALDGVLVLDPVLTAASTPVVCSSTTLPKRWSCGRAPCTPWSFWPQPSTWCCRPAGGSSFQGPSSSSGPHHRLLTRRCRRRSLVGHGGRRCGDCVEGDQREFGSALIDTCAQCLLEDRAQRGPGARIGGGIARERCGRRVRIETLRSRRSRPAAAKVQVDLRVGYDVTEPLGVLAEAGADDVSAWRGTVEHFEDDVAATA